MQNARLYYYFSSKDKAVILCADVVALRFENTLISTTLKDLLNMNYDEAVTVESRCNGSGNVVLASVCASKWCKDSVKSILDRLSKRYGEYA